MKIEWIIKENEINRLCDFITQQNNPFVVSRIKRNVKHENLNLTKNSVIRGLLMCLLTTQQRSGPNTPVSIFLRKKPFPVTIEIIETSNNIEDFTRSTLLENGLNRYINKIPMFFAHNFELLRNTDWALLDALTKTLLKKTNRIAEREIADSINLLFSGFGPKQSRNLLQSLGLTKYEIPIDSRITNWLNDFGFPMKLSSNALQDIGYYHFVSDGIQELCKKADVYPCVLDAAIFSSFDNGQWTEGNIVY